MFAAIASGHGDLAEVLFLVAFVLTAVAAVVCGLRNAFESALGWAGVACVALSFLVL
jgi:hypothetical protein